jgi:ATP-dependent Clp protease ATP-binding subunit ClpX
VADQHLEHCSFCGKHKDQVQKLIVGEMVAICNECVVLCQDLLSDVSPQVEKNNRDPQEIKQFLDQYVIGQDQAKIVLAVAVVNHYKRLNRASDDIEIEKSNILMIGPTGSGKTLLARSIARYLDVPFAIADATSLTEAGYVGDDVETLISRLYANSGYNLEKTQKGIVFVDEIDKISRKSESASITRDVSGEGVQQALLKMVEGTTCRIPTQVGRKHPAGDMVEIDTSNILFVAGGAFVGLQEIISQRVNGTSIGFNSTMASRQDINLSQLAPDDLVKFGMIPEFVGRFPTMVSLTELDKNSMLQILTGIRNNLPDQYRWIFSQDGIDLTFQAAALEQLVDRAMQSGTGARALHSELERVLMPHMFSLVQYQRRGIKSVEIGPEQVNNPSSL